MTVQVVGIFLGILFTALCFLHYRVNQTNKDIDTLYKQNHELIGISESNHLMMLGLVSILIDKEILEPEDIFGKNVPEHFQKKVKPQV